MSGLEDRTVVVNAVWVKPSPLWQTETFSALKQSRPDLLAIASDEFIDEFLAAMALPPEPDGKAALPPNASIQADSSRGWLAAARMNPPTSGMIKLYQPLHGQFHLVIGSLICKAPGLPDVPFSPKRGDRAFFVIRRTWFGGEEGWSDTHGWVPVAPDGSVSAHEEQLPLFPAPFRSVPEGSRSQVPCDRQLFYGYIPTGNREKYKEKPNAHEARSGFVQRLSEDAELQKVVQDSFSDRITDPWKRLATTTPADPAERPDYYKRGSLTLVTALYDWLHSTLPDLAAALIANSPSGLDAPAPAAFNFINDLEVIVYDTLDALTLGDALRAVAQLIEDDAEMDADLLRFDLARVPVRNSSGTILSKTVISATTIDKVQAAIFDILTSQYADAPAQLAQTPGLQAIERIYRTLVKPIIVSKATKQPIVETYTIRLAYEYDPECPPVVSEPSLPFVLAGYFDPDAPPRMVRIEMPSIRPKDLRKYAKGVGLQFTPELNNTIDRVNPDMLKGGGLGPPGLSIAMICTFSIQIITLVALIVMFIFLILLNIVFWWLAFIRICIPIPTREA